MPRPTHDRFRGPLHQSGAKTLEDCPGKFEAEARNLDPHFAPFKRGNVLAELAEELRGALAVDDPRPVLSILRHGLRRREAKLRDAADLADVVSIVELLGSEESRIARASWYPPAPAVVRLEERWGLDGGFAAVAADSPLAAFVGTFDVEIVDDERTGDAVRLEDDKTWAFIPSADEIASDVQARTYALAALARYPGAPRVRFRWNLLRHGFSLDFEFERGAPWEASHRAWLLARLSERDAFVASGTWPRRVGDGCDSCPIRFACEDLRAVIEQGARIPELEPEERARRYLVLKGLLTEYEKAVRRDAADGPLVIGDGKVLGFRPKTKREFRDGTESKLLEDLGTLGVKAAELDGFFPRRIGVGSVEKAFKAADPETWRDWVGSFVAEVRTTEFTTFRTDAGAKP
jgi:hypothetical protein